MTTRRSILQLLMIGSAGTVVGQFACARCSDRSAESEPTSLRARLLHLFLVVGPWPEDRRAEATTFYEEVLTDERVASYQADAPAVRRLWRAFADSPMALDRIAIADMDEGEWALLERIIDDAYTPGHHINETRFVVSQTPLPGLCMGPGWALYDTDGK